MAEKLNEIYEAFVDQLINDGWNGQSYGWKQTVRAELVEGGWAYFQLDNGFNLKLTYEGIGPEQAKLQYWFTENGKMVEVQSLEQLLELLN